MEIVTVNDVRNKIDHLLDETATEHKPVFITGSRSNGVLIGEEDWNSIQKQLESMTPSYINWTGCEVVEQIPGKVSGRPIVRGTRILADTIVQDAELGSSLEEIYENYPDLALNTIRQLIAFAELRLGHNIS